MPSKYIGNNNHGAEASYKLRSIYKHLSFPSDIPYIDTANENRLYGKVDRRGDACYLMTEDSKGALEYFEGTSGVFGVNFVVRAFEDFRRSYIELLASNSTQPPPGIMPLLPTSCWHSFDLLRENHISEMKKYFVSFLLKRNEKDIQNFDDFVRVFIKEHMEPMGVQFPITRTGIVLLNNTPTEVSGLAINLSENDISDDSVKTPMVESEYFTTYVAKAEQFGFLVDKNAPWRLVANLSSTKMLRYMVRAGVRRMPGSASDYFEEYCMKTHMHDMDDLRGFLTSTYQSFVASNPSVKRTAVCSGKTVSRLSHRKPIDETEKKYNVVYWLRLLLRVRLEESPSESSISVRQFQKIITRAKIAYRYYNLERALNVINQAVKGRSLAYANGGNQIMIAKRLDNGTKIVIESLDRVTPMGKET